MRPRTILLALAAIIIAVLVVLSIADQFLVDFLWFGSLGGVMISLKGVYEHSPGEWQDKYDLWHYGRPASGAIAGVMGAYLVKYPRSRILNLIFIFFFITTAEIPAVVMLAYWFLIQLFSGVGSIVGVWLGWKLARKLEEINRAATMLGIPFRNPNLTLETLSTAAIPYFRICEEGLVNLKVGETVGLVGE